MESEKQDQRNFGSGRWNRFFNRLASGFHDLLNRINRIRFFSGVQHHLKTDEKIRIDDESGITTYSDKQTGAAWNDKLLVGYHWRSYKCIQIDLTIREAQPPTGYTAMLKILREKAISKK